METILITGSSGFIGFHLSQRLLNDGYSVIGIDNMNDYYDVSLKQARLEILKQHHNFQFFLLDLVDRISIMNLFKENKITTVVNLAAQAGVRYSLENPHAYVDSNLIGFVNILEACRHHNIQHLVYASSSSVYGANKKFLFPLKIMLITLSAYTPPRKANELMAHTYSHLYNIPTTGLRFFTVYGTYGRPDMAYFIFTKNILEGKKIKVFNYGDMQRDFTYIDDIIEGVVRVMKQIPTPQTDNPNSKAPYRLYNIGNNKPVKLIDFITTIEKSLGVTAEKEFLPIQPGDVPITYADVDDLYKSVGFKPSTPIEKGIDEFVKWYREFYQN